MMFCTCAVGLNKNTAQPSLKKIRLKVEEYGNAPDCELMFHSTVGQNGSSGT